MTITSNSRPATGASRSPRSARTRTPFSAAFSRTLTTARREMSIAVGLGAGPRGHQRQRARARAQVEHRSARARVDLRAQHAREHPRVARRPEDPRQSHQPHMTRQDTHSGAAIRAAFDEPAPLTVGIEEELMLLDPTTLDLAPRAGEVIARTDGDPRYKLELPAAQLEIVSPPLASAGAVHEFLAQARADLQGRRRRPGPAAGLRRRPSVRARRGRAERRRALRAHDRRSTGASRGASWSSASRFTWRSAAPTARSPSTTRCAAGCPS